MTGSNPSPTDGLGRHEGFNAAVKHILFPFDFSEACRATIPFVNAMADACGSRITVLSVSPAGPDGNLSARLQTAEAGQLDGGLKSRLDAELSEAFGSLPVVNAAEAGDPEVRIAHFAQENGVDLIMMPTRGYGSFRSVLVGSVTSSVLRDTKTPTWTVTHVKGMPVSLHLPCRRILCAVDGTATTATLMKWSADFSRHAGAALTLLHVVAPVSDWEGLESERALQEQVRESAREKMTELRDSVGVDAPLAIAIGSVSSTVTEEAKRHDTDLIIIGRGSIRETLGRLRTHALEIIQRSPCPVLSV